MENNIKLEEIKEIIHKIGKKLCDKLQDEKLKNMFYDCFVNTIDTTVSIGDNDILMPMLLILKLMEISGTMISQRIVHGYGKENMKLIQCVIQ